MYKEKNQAMTRKYLHTLGKNKNKKQKSKEGKKKKKLINWAFPIYIYIQPGQASMTIYFTAVI